MASMMMITNETASGSPTTTGKSAALRRRSPLQIPAKVINWLHRSYVAEDRCQVPKAALYDAYEEFCRNEKIRPKPPNVFGKIIKQVYPHVGTSRMGSHLHQVPYYTGLAPRVHPLSKEATTATTASPSTPPSSASSAVPSAASAMQTVPQQSTALAHQLNVNLQHLNAAAAKLRNNGVLLNTTNMKKNVPTVFHMKTTIAPTTATPIKRQVPIAPTPAPASPPPTPMATTPTITTTTTTPIPVSPFGAVTTLRPLSPAKLPTATTFIAAMPPPFLPRSSTERRSPTPAEPSRPLTDEDRMIQSIKEKFLSYTQPVHVK